MSDQNSKKFSVYDLVIVGVMAAIIFVLTYFIKIKIPTPAGETMLKVANAFCLLAGILFGGLRGGLAAGIGSMFYDLLDPTYITSAPTTFLKFFLMALFCGLVAKAMRKKEIGYNLDGLGFVGRRSNQLCFDVRRRELHQTAHQRRRLNSRNHRNHT